MSTGRFALGVLVAVVAASMLTGCATLEQRTLISIPEGSTHLSWQAAPFTDVAPAGIRYSGVDENEDYLLYRAHGMQSELVFINAIPAMSATINLIEYNGKDLRRLTRTWAINQHAGLQWEGTRHLRTPLANFSIRRYRLTHTHRRCAAFQARWDIAATPQRWAGKLVFGYLCAAAGQALTQPKVTALVSGLRVHHPGAGRNPTLLPRLLPTPVRSHNGQAAHGNASFPFLFGTYHPTGGGGTVSGSAPF
ncbi:MAG TPA: hypothetical protein VFA48_13780 [Gammaproteobacteria bacterium]|nr:hypothetical protein [Gammaproteobacteria bacterium]